MYRVVIEGAKSQRVSNQHESTQNFRYYLHGISPYEMTLVYVGVEHPDGRKKQLRICTILAQEGSN